MGAKFQRVTGEEAKKIEQQMNSGAALTPPDDCRRSKKDPNDKYWAERVKITGVSAETTTSNAGDEHEVLEIEAVILTQRPNGDTSTNDGRNVKFNNRLNWAAWEKKDVKDGQYKMHTGTQGRMQSLFRAAGFYAGGDIEVELWQHAFPESGLSPLVGLEFDVEIRQRPNDQGREFPELSRVILPDDIAVPTVTNGVAVAPARATVTL